MHRDKVLPRWVGVVERALPNTDKIGPDCLGALVSLTYNRGASFGKDGERFREMRNIRSHLQGRQYARIPGELRSMKRLWPNLTGLQKRREREARFQWERVEKNREWRTAAAVPLLALALWARASWLPPLW